MIVRITWQLSNTFEIYVNLENSFNTSTKEYVDRFISNIINQSTYRYAYVLSDPS